MAARKQKKIVRVILSALVIMAVLPLGSCTIYYKLKEELWDKYQAEEKIDDGRRPPVNNP